MVVTRPERHPQELAVVDRRDTQGELAERLQVTPVVAQEAERLQDMAVQEAERLQDTPAVALGEHLRVTVEPVVALAGLAAWVAWVLVAAVLHRRKRPRNCHPRSTNWFDCTISKPNRTESIGIEFGC